MGGDSEHAARRWRTFATAHAHLAAATARKGAIRIGDVVKIYGPQGAGVLRRRPLHVRCSAPAKSTCRRRPVRMRQDDAAQCHRRLPQHHVRAASISTAKMLCGPASRRPSRARTASSYSRTARCFPWKTNHRERRIRADGAGHAEPRSEAYEKARAMLAEPGCAASSTITPARFPRACAGGSRSCAR